MSNFDISANATPYADPTPVETQFIDPNLSVLDNLPISAHAEEDRVLVTESNEGLNSDEPERNDPSYSEEPKESYQTEKGSVASTYPPWRADFGALAANMLLTTPMTGVRNSILSGSKRVSDWGSMIEKEEVKPDPSKYNSLITLVEHMDQEIPNELLVPPFRSKILNPTEIKNTRFLGHYNSVPYLDKNFCLHEYRDIFRTCYRWCALDLTSLNADPFKVAGDLLSTYVTELHSAPVSTYPLQPLGYLIGLPTRCQYVPKMLDSQLVQTIADYSDLMSVIDLMINYCSDISTSSTPESIPTILHRIRCETNPPKAHNLSFQEFIRKVKMHYPNIDAVFHNVGIPRVQEVQAARQLEMFVAKLLNLWGLCICLGYSQVNQYSQVEVVSRVREIFQSYCNSYGNLKHVMSSLFALPLFEDRSFNLNQYLIAFVTYAQEDDKLLKNTKTNAFYSYLGPKNPAYVCQLLPDDYFDAKGHLRGEKRKFLSEVSEVHQVHIQPRYKNKEEVPDASEPPKKKVFVRPPRGGLVKDISSDNYEKLPNDDYQLITACKTRTELLKLMANKKWEDKILRGRCTRCFNIASNKHRCRYFEREEIFKAFTEEERCQYGLGKTIHSKK